MAELIATLGPHERLALAYAPAAARPGWLALLALDARLAQMVRAAREPVLAQLRLAWWRERLGEEPARWPRGEPLLALLADLPAATLVPLVDGWEALLGEAPLDHGGFEAWLAGRSAALMLLGGDAPAVASMARGWALGDLAERTSHPDERAIVAALAAAHDWRRAPLPRPLRPLLVLHHFARRAGRGQRGGLFGAMRLGLLGR